MTYGVSVYAGKSLTTDPAQTCFFPSSRGLFRGGGGSNCELYPAATVVPVTWHAGELNRIEWEVKYVNQLVINSYMDSFISYISHKLFGGNIDGI